MFKRLLSKFKYNKKTEIDFFVSSIIKEYKKQTGEECDAALSEESRLIIDGFEFNIATMFELYEQENKNNKPRFIKMLIKNTFASDEIEDFEQVKDKILPIVRPIAYHEIMQLQIGIDHKFENDDHHMPYKKIGADLCIVFFQQKESYDDSGNVHVVLKGITNHCLAIWNQNLDVITDIALKNINKQQPVFKELTPEIWISHSQDSWLSSMLHIEQIKNLPNLRGDPVAFLVSKDYFIVSSSDDIEGLKKAFEFVDGYMTDARFISSQAFILKEDKWQIFSPSEEHSLYKELRKRQLLTEKEQFDYLADLIKQKSKISVDNTSFFVAEYNINFDNNQVESFAIWMQGYDMIIMPIVDIIILDIFGKDEEDKVFITTAIPIAKLMNICENRFSSCPWSSQYVMLQGFPATEELKKLGVSI